MKHERWLIGYGVFLFACGIAGFLSNPTEAKTALISGSVFGGLAVLWGVLLGKGHGFAKWAALGMSVMLCGVFCWRFTVILPRMKICGKLIGLPICFFSRATENFPIQPLFPNHKSSCALV
jgi:hypothetical protein